MSEKRAASLGFAESLAGHYVVMSRGEVVKSGKGAGMARDNVKATLPV